MLKKSAKESKQDNIEYKKRRGEEKGVSETIP